MPEPLKPADLSKIKTHSLSERKSLVGIDCFARAVDSSASLAQFLAGLGDVLAVRSLRGLARSIAIARQAERPVVWAMGGHAIKVGLGPVLIRMMRQGTINALVLNGAAAIHDWEISAAGATSEDVEAELASGRFGMTEETGREFSAAAREAVARDEGLGDALARRIVESDRPHREYSVLAAAWDLGLPVTVHVAIGSDVVHQHPAADGAAEGAASHTDFRRVISLVSRLSRGVWVNCGSAVQLPEVFLKALGAARNLGHEFSDVTMANLDMQQHYRTQQNLLKRPVRESGRSYQLIGHHEINIPLLAATVELERERLRHDS